MENKRVWVLSIALILTAMIVGVAFAEGNDEYEYTISVVYNVSVGGRTVQKTVEYTVWASSAYEAGQMALARCEREKGNAASCGAPIATGRKR
jgi:phosphate/sulfate permease